MPQRAPAPPTVPAFVTLSAIADHCGVPKNVVRKWIASGKLPKPLKLSRKHHVWNQQEITCIIERQRSIV